MSVLPKELVRVAAESVSATVQDDAAGTLTSDIEARLRVIIQLAVKFMRHAKRNMLTAEDINLALRARNLEV